MKSAIVSTMNSGTKSNPAGVYKEKKSNIGDKISRDTSPQRGFLIFYLFPEWKNKAFPPPSPPCNVVPQFELHITNNKCPNFEGRGGGGVWILLFSVVTIFEYNVSTILLLIGGYR